MIQPCRGIKPPFFGRCQGNSSHWPFQKRLSCVCFRFALYSLPEARDWIGDSMFASNCEHPRLQLMVLAVPGCAWLLCRRLES